jgi:hypothetical protein
VGCTREWEWEWALRGGRNEKDITEHGNEKRRTRNGMAEQEWWQNTEWPTTLAALISSRDIYHKLKGNIRMIIHI